MNPDTNKFEMLFDGAKESLKENIFDRDEIVANAFNGLFRSNGKPVPKHWSIFKVGEEVIIKNYTFKVAYINESSILFEPVGPIIIKGEEK